jgi:hypothetical protein
MLWIGNCTQLSMIPLSEGFNIEIEQDLQKRKWIMCITGKVYLTTFVTPIFEWWSPGSAYLTGFVPLVLTSKKQQ